MKMHPTAMLQHTLLALLLLLSTSAKAQKTNVWKGGTPGQETNWNCPRNWSNNAVPNEFSDVIIPEVSTTRFSLPIIQSGRFEVNSLSLLPGAYLTIASKAQLMVCDRPEGVNEYSVRGQGLLLIQKAVDELEAKTAGGGK